jgi:hypothetical protein
MLRQQLTHLVADPSASGSTSQPNGSQLSGGVTLVFVLLFLLCTTVSCTTLVITLGVPEEGSLVMCTLTGRRVASGRALIVTAGSTASVMWRRSKGALRRRPSSRRVPLRSSSRLVYIIPALAVLVPLGEPSRRHRRRGTVLECTLAGRDESGP